MFDWKKPTVQMLGRWQPWHEGHQELFKRCLKKTGQVIIQVRDAKQLNRLQNKLKTINRIYKIERR